MYKYFIKAIFSFLLSINIIVLSIIFKSFIDRINTSSSLYPGFFISAILYIILRQSKVYLSNLINDYKTKKTYI